MMRQRLMGLCLVVWLLGCAPKEQAPVTIAINPWPGYELLYLAEKKGFYEQVGANVKFYQLGSLADAQRAYLNGRADGMASTLVEALQSQLLSNNPLKIVMVTDYSNGGDVIIAGRSAQSLSDLKGGTIGCEVSSLGIYFLQRALVKSGLTLNDVTVVNIEQVDGYSALISGEIDAFVSYPPASLNVLKNSDYQVIFSSADIPQEIIDVVSLSDQVLKNNPQLVEKLHRAWDLAINEYRNNPDQSAAIMAKREQVSVEDFKAVLDNDLVVMSSAKQRVLMSDHDSLKQKLVEVCNTLVHVGSLEADCSQLPNIIFKF